MPDFTKLAAYLDSFDRQDPNYDIACFIKSKIAQDLSDPRTVNNSGDEEIGDNDITMATPEQQSENNTEGELMSGAFREFDVLNKMQKEKEEVKHPNKQNNSPSKTLHSADSADFPGVGQIYNQISKVSSVSLLSAFKKRFKK